MGGAGAGGYVAFSDISLLPALPIALAAFLGVFVWVVRRHTGQ